jgi:bifunctional non-homologous end joining protein LigD
MISWFEREIKPMLAVRGKPFSSSDYIYEPKWDGTRCLAFVDVNQKKLRLQNRRFLNITYRYPELEFMDFLKENAILDGEIVVLEKGTPSFKLLQKREQVDSKLKIDILSKLIPAVYFTFDVLYTENNGWIMDLPLMERRKILEEISNETAHILKSEYIKEEGERFYKVAVDAGFEGIIAKRTDSKYQPGKRSDAWVKMKKRNTADCIIVGWLEGEGRRTGLFGSLVLALLDGKRFVHIGQVGTGFDAEFLGYFFEKLKKLEVNKPTIPNLNFKRRVYWVKPKYVCEVEFLEVTEDRKLRAPVFLRLREDKTIDECTVEQLE